MIASSASDWSNNHYCRPIITDAHPHSLDDGDCHYNCMSSSSRLLASCPFKNRFHIQLLFHSRHQFHCKVISYFCRDLDHLLDLFIYGSNLLDHQRMSISRLQFHIKSPQKTFVTDIKDHIERESLFGWIHL